MESILIHTGNKKDLNLLKSLATKMGFKSEILSLEEREDLALARAIEENKPEDMMTFQEGMAYYKTLDKTD